MITISSHVLDSVLGDHAQYIKIACYSILENDSRQKLFDVTANKQGRIAEKVNVEVGQKCEIVFHTTDYFSNQPAIPDSEQIMDEVVVRFKVPADSDKIHIPMMLSPHSYSIWWSA
ncbi:MAG: hydroxyisourate hydrolase [Chloroflexota bacterium]